MDSRNLIVHIGMPKAASTTLQRHFFSRSNSHTFLGLPFQDQRLREFRRRLLHQDFFDFALEREIQLFSRIFNELTAATSGAAIWSDEALSWTKGVDRSILCDRIAQVMRPSKIVVVIREQISAIYSHHAMDAFKSAKSYARIGDINQWVDSVWPYRRRGINHLRYFPVLSYYAKRFGRDNIIILHFEDLKRAPDRFFGQLEEVCGVPVIESAQDVPVENKRKGTKRVQVAASLKNRFFPNTRLSSWLPGSTRASLREYLAGGEGSKVELDEQHLEMLRQYFAEDNRRVQAEFELDLRSYGYMLD